MTGAPKIRAMEIIDELEAARRGPYCGAIGWIGTDRSMELSIAIRTLVVTPGRVIAQAGGGIVADSEAAAEYEEARTKARPLLATLDPNWRERPVFRGRPPCLTPTFPMVWLNGVFCTAESARIDIRDRGFTLGDGVFETLRVKDGRILAARTPPWTGWQQELRLLEIRPALRRETPWRRRWAQVASAAGSPNAAAAPDDHARPRPTRGIDADAGRHIPTDPSDSGSLHRLAGARRKLFFATVTRRNEHSPLSRIKSTNTLDTLILARMEAARAGTDDAILLNNARDGSPGIHDLQSSSR